MSQTFTVPCNRCGTNVPILPEHEAHGALCDKCLDGEVREQFKITAKTLRLRDWCHICPPLYQDTVIERLPHPTLSLKALEWPGTPPLPWRGLNLWGFPRTGKTRTMFLVLRKAFLSGKNVRQFGPAEFAQECEMRDFRSAGYMRGLSMVDILAFDDIDKCKLSKNQEDKFFALLDARVKHRKPTFFTGNTKGDELKTKFYNGEAIVARMREHSISIHFPQQQTLAL